MKKILCLITLLPEILQSKTQAMEEVGFSCLNKAVNSGETIHVILEKAAETEYSYTVCYGVAGVVILLIILLNLRGNCY